MPASRQARGTRSVFRRGESTRIGFMRPLDSQIRTVRRELLTHTGLGHHHHHGRQLPGTAETLFLQSIIYRQGGPPFLAGGGDSRLDRQILWSIAQSSWRVDATQMCPAARPIRSELHGGYNEADSGVAGGGAVRGGKCAGANCPECHNRFDSGGQSAADYHSTVGLGGV